jgi:hypothetical protein
MLTKEQRQEIDQQLKLKVSNYYDFIEVNNIKFYFSEDKFLQRFKEKLDESVSTFNQKINRIYRYAYDIQFDDLALIRLYMSIEKRGFLLETDGVKITCLNQIKIQGKIKIVS